MGLMTTNKKLAIGGVIIAAGITVGVLLPPIIPVQKAYHLDVNRHRIKDITEQVTQLDDLWSEVIPIGDWVRVTFEEKLDNTRDIKMVVRSADLCVTTIEVYEKNDDQIIYEVDGIGPKDWYIFPLENLIGTQNTFDLRITGCPATFDYIIDPEGDYVGKWSTAAQTGITDCAIYNNEFYIPDPGLADDVFVYNMTGSYQRSISVNEAGNLNPYGVYVDATHVYTADFAGHIYIHLLNGTYDSTITLTDVNADNANAVSLTGDGTYFYVLDQGDQEVYIYNSDWSYTSTHFDTNANCPGNYYGITNNGTNIFVEDYLNAKVCKYDMTGVYVSSFDTTNVANPKGVCYDSVNNYIYVVENDEVYYYEGPTPEATGQMFIIK